MSCITDNIGNKGGCLSARINRVGNTLNANIGLADEHILATISRIGGNLKANVSIICTPNTDVYLFVEPEVIWLTPDTMSADFVVKSNTKWIIE